jgi:hypothetical protein
MATKKKNTGKACVVKTGYKYIKGGRVVKAKAKKAAKCGCKKK